MKRVGCRHPNAYGEYSSGKSINLRIALHFVLQTAFDFVSATFLDLDDATLASCATLGYCTAHNFLCTARCYFEATQLLATPVFLRNR